VAVTPFARVGQKRLVASAKVAPEPPFVRPFQAGRMGATALQVNRALYGRVNKIKISNYVLIMNKTTTAFLAIVMTMVTGCMEKEPSKVPSPLLTTTGAGDVVIYEPESKIAYFITKSGVLFKTVSILKPDNFRTYKEISGQIHNSTDSLSVTAEWIGEKVFWTISTNKLNTRMASNIGLTTIFGTEIIRLCTICDWGPVFDNNTGKTSNYSVSGTVENVSIDEWNSSYGMTYRAKSDK
jgi:hypothetical protein